MGNCCRRQHKMLPDRAGQAKRAAPPQAGRRRQGLKPEWGETGNRARFTKARSWPWPGDAMSRLLRIRLDRRAQRARQPSVTSGALSGCQRSLGLALPRFISRNPAAMGARRAPTGLLALSKPHPGVSSRSGPWTSEVRLYEAISVAGTPPTNSQAFQSLSNG